LFDHLVHAGADHLEIVEVIQMAAFDTRPALPLLLSLNAEVVTAWKPPARPRKRA
jgi:hypothetical protein